MQNMKKTVSILLALFMILAVLASCDLLPSAPDEPETPSVSESEESDSDGQTESSAESDSGDIGGDTSSHTYTDFTGDEKSLFIDTAGLVIPFIPNDEYYVEEYTYETEVGVNFYTVGNTKAEFDTYRALFLDYTYDGTEDDDYGDAWYYYSKGDIYVDMSYYTDDEGNCIVDVYVYILNEDSGDGGDQGGDASDRTYTDFTSAEKSLFESYFGFVIPFMPTSEYYVEEYILEPEEGINFYTYGNTASEFAAYRDLFAGYTYDGTAEDDWGDAWYYYSKGDVYVDMSYYTDDEGNYVVDVYVYTLNESGDQGGNQGGDASNHVYTDFTSEEKTLFSDTVGLVIPFIPNDEYYVEAYAYETELGLSFYTFGNTQAEFDAFRALFSDYSYDGTEDDEYGDAWYYYSKGNVYVDMSFYYYDNEYVVDVYVYILNENSEGGEDQGGGASDHTYTEFTSEEKSLFESYFGFVIPFMPTSEYYVEEYTLESEEGINFYTYGNTASEFSAYRELFSGYTYDGTDTDDWGDAWYYYSNGDIYIDMSYYPDDEGNYVVDVYVYVLNEDSGEGGDQGGGSVGSDANVITNDGKGLPQSANGIYDVDFTKGNYVQNVTDQGYYVDGCPTTGSPAVLVIPIEFIDATAASKGYTIDNIEKIFNGKSGDTSYYSVHDYFYISSYEKLDLNITVVDSWFRPEKESSYYENATYDYYGDEIEIGDQLILDEALAYLSTIMDLSEFDSDNNGIIDAVVMVNTLDIGDNNFHWAYRYWNVYTDDEGYYYEYDNVSANDYVWISYEFVFEAYDENGDVNYDASNPLNPYTFIHEFSHALGADDYYDTEYQQEPLGGYDVMDSFAGDHNPYSKFNYGWITTSKLVVTDSSVTVTLDPFAKNGDTVIIGNNWDESLGAYQEYYVIMYYTASELNSGEGGYFSRDGVIVYHVNSSLYAEDYEGETCYDVYNNNSTGEYGTENNLIEFVLSGEGHYTYVAGDSLPDLTLDSGESLSYTFTVDSVTSEGATLTFTRK